MKTVSCECKKCHAAVGLFANLWIQIGKSYLGPVIEPDEELAIRSEGKTRVGESGTLVEECLLQNFICDNCSAVLGLRCIETPVNHVLDDNQVLLRIASVILLDGAREEIELVIKRVLSINKPSRANPSGVPDPSSNFPGIVELQQLKFDLEGQKEYLKHVDNNGFKIVTGLDKRMGRVENDVKTLSSTVSGFRDNIRGAQEGIKSLKSELSGFKQSGTDTSKAIQGLENRLSFVESSLEEVQHQVTGLTEEMQEGLSDLRSELHQIQQEVDTLRSEANESVGTVNYAQGIATMRAEIAQLRRELDTVRTNERDRPAPFPSKELDILTSNIAKIGNRASQVETLQMELEILKGRVDRAEATREASNNRRLTYPLDTGTFPQHTGTRKRASSPKPETVSKRTVSSNYFSDSLALGYSAVPLTPLTQDNNTRNFQKPKKRGRPKTVTGNSSETLP